MNQSYMKGIKMNLTKCFTTLALATCISSAFAQHAPYVNPKEAECLAQTLVLEQRNEKFTNTQLEALGEMFINRLTANGYANTLCVIRDDRAVKPWNKSYVHKISSGWTNTSYAREKTIARKLYTFYKMGIFEYHTGGALEYNFTGELPSQRMFKTVRVGKIHFYSTYK